MNRRGWWSGGAPGTGDGSANDADDADKSSGGGAGVAERVASVVHVARKVQNHLGAVCDAAEKVKRSTKIPALLLIFTIQTVSSSQRLIALIERLERFKRFSK